MTNEELLNAYDYKVGLQSRHPDINDDIEDMRAELLRRLGAAVSVSPQPRCPEHKIAMVQKVDRKVPFWGCPNDGCGLFLSVELLNQVAQFFAAAPAQEPSVAKCVICSEVEANYRHSEVGGSHYYHKFRTTPAAPEQPMENSPQKGKP